MFGVILHYRKSSKGVCDVIRVEMEEPVQVSFSARSTTGSRNFKLGKTNISLGKMS